MTTPVVFPVEIIEKVLQHVHDSHDTKSLRNSSYANKTLCALSQKLLFHEIQLFSGTNFDRKTPWRAFDDLLDRSPHLSGYVQILQLTRDVLTLMSRNKDDNLQKIINHLPELKKISITMDSKSARNDVSWATIAPKIQNALLEGLKLPGLVDVDLSGIPYFPPVLFKEFQAPLKRLTITELKPEPDMPNLLKNNAQLDPQSTTTVRHRFALETMVIFDIILSDFTMKWLPSYTFPISLLQVQDLTLRTFKLHQDISTSEGLEDLENLLRAFAPNLKRLTYRLSPSNLDTNNWAYTEPHSLPPPDFAGILPSLRFLELQCRWYNLEETASLVHDSYVHPMSWLNIVLKKSATMSLETIVLSMVLIHPDVYIAGVDWNELLSDVDDKLKSIIELRISGPEQDEKDIMLKNRHLKKLPKGIVFV